MNRLFGASKKEEQAPPPPKKEEEVVPTLPKPTPVPLSEQQARVEMPWFSWRTRWGSCQKQWPSWTTRPSNCWRNQKRPKGLPEICINSAALTCLKNASSMITSSRPTWTSNSLLTRWASLPRTSRTRSRWYNSLHSGRNHEECGRTAERSYG